MLYHVKAYAITYKLNTSKSRMMETIAEHSLHFNQRTDLKFYGLAENC